MKTKRKASERGAQSAGRVNNTLGIGAPGEGLSVLFHRCRVHGYSDEGSDGSHRCRVHGHPDEGSDGSARPERGEAPEGKRQRAGRSRPDELTCCKCNAVS